MKARKLTARGLRALILDEAAKAKKSEDGVMTRVYDGKKYTASAGSVASLEKHGMSAEKAVKAGDFDWADNPMAAAQAAHIVATGKPTVPKGTKISESQLRHMIRQELVSEALGGDKGAAGEEDADKEGADKDSVEKAAKKLAAAPGLDAALKGIDTIQEIEPVLRGFIEKIVKASGGKADDGEIMKVLKKLVREL